MILRTLLAALVTLIFFYGYYKYSNAPKAQRKTILIQWGGALLAFILLTLVAFGKLHWIGAVFAALIPIARALFPLLIKAFPILLHTLKHKASSTVHSGNNSQVKTAYLTLNLDHDSGDISGEMTDGLYKSRTLASLSIAEIKKLLGYYQTNDQESFRLLMAYAQRTYPDETFEGSTNNSARAPA
ncbi:hypothetical protein NBRC116494_18180 [Aurantivibrio plasticivorans]